MAPSTMRLVAAAACGFQCAGAAFADFTDAQALLQSHVGASSVQPEYAKPHVHGWEKGKQSLIKTGQQIDGILKDTKRALNNLTGVLVSTGVLDKKCDLGRQVPEGAAQLYTVDNSRLKASTSGVGYRFRKIMWDRDLHTVAHWGSTIEGVDHGDGWLQVGDCFLPMAMQEVPVIRPAQAQKQTASLLEIGEEWPQWQRANRSKQQTKLQRKTKVEIRKGEAAEAAAKKEEEAKAARELEATAAAKKAEEEKEAAKKAEEEKKAAAKKAEEEKAAAKKAEEAKKAAKKAEEKKAAAKKAEEEKRAAAKRAEAAEAAARAQRVPHVGDEVEVTMKAGEQAGQVLKGVVEGVDAETSLYTLLLPHAPEQYRHVAQIPQDWIRRGGAHADGVLLLWALTSKESSMDLVKKNVDHLRRTYRGKADVMFVHVDDGKSDWIDAGEAWYNANVQFSGESKMPKQLLASSSMLYAAEYYPPQLRLAKSVLPGILAKGDYSWVWVVDEDLDFSGTNLTKLFGDAEKTGSLIVAPSVKFEDSMPMQKAASKMYVPGCNFAQAMCFIHTPQPRCQYRYTNFIEAPFPIMKPAAFKAMAEWGESQVDRVWCTRPAVTLLQDPKQVCAILDQVSVKHTNGKTLRKWEAVDKLHGSSNGNMLSQEATFVQDIATLKCVQ